MIAYAGIGSRTITETEQKQIHKIAKSFAEKDYIVYSGNAEGADIAFQTGSQGKCVLLVPWKNFNKDKYDHSKSLAKFDVGDTVDGNSSTDKFHPNPKSLSQGGRRMMSRNWHQIVGYDQYPKVSFVMCCADQDENGIFGGTGQACRIAKSMNIPIFNIRTLTWIDDLVKFLKEEIK
jgi:hypothetical protein